MDLEVFMKRAISLAKKGLGHTYPNPLVGAVIVYNGKIIGEGYHTQAGKPHAEINAINSVKDKSLLQKSVLFVTLEPCSHFGRTPPCALKIAELKIPKVVVATIDTTEKVNGKGIKIMKDAGIEVITSVLEKQARELNKRFFTYHEKKRPYIILKWAQTADGFIDKIRKEKGFVNWITGKTERILVHKWRSEEQAILVGTKTVETDDPILTVRDFYGKNPLRCFIDKNCNLVKKSKITNSASKTLCFTFSDYKSKNSNLEIIKFNQKNDLTVDILHYFYSVGIQSFIIEGGSKTLQSFIDKGLWDEARVFFGKKLFFNGIKAPVFRTGIREIKSIEFKESFLKVFKNADDALYP